MKKIIISTFLATFKNRQHLQSQQQQYEAATSSTSSSTSLGLCQEIYYHDPTFSEGESILEVREKQTYTQGNINVRVFFLFR